MKEVLFIESKREGYGINQINKTMTICELISFLEEFDSETEIYLRNDGGYTYGGITEDSIEINEIENKEEE